MRRRCSMNIVNCSSSDVHGTLESKRHIRSPDIVVNGLWQTHHIQAFLPEKIGCFLRSVATQDHQTV